MTVLDRTRLIDLRVPFGACRRLDTEAKLRIFERIADVKSRGDHVPFREDEQKARRRI